MPSQSRKRNVVNFREKVGPSALALGQVTLGVGEAQSD